MKTRKPRPVDEDGNPFGKPVSVRLTDPVHKALKKKAAAAERTLSSYVRWVLRRVARDEVQLPAA
jgi:predicted HicB family RNase H-like nuclease